MKRVITRAQKDRINVTQRQRRQKGADLWFKYGMTSELYWAIKNEQTGVCAICGKPETRLYKGSTQDLVVDHCHDSHEVRGLLCHKCNSGIGLLNDDPDLLAKAIKYLGGETDERIGDRRCIRRRV